MKKRIVGLLLIALLTVAVPATAIITYSGSQYWCMSGYGYCYVYDYNLSTGLFHGTILFVNGSGYAWDAVRTQWRAIWIYDYVFGGWSDLSYAYLYG